MNKRAVNLARAILDRCYSGHWSPGKFLLRVSGSPKIPKASSKVGKAIVIQAVTYIGVTRMARVQMPEELLRDAEGSVTIQKVVWNAGKKIEVEVC